MRTKSSTALAKMMIEDEVPLAALEARTIVATGPCTIVKSTSMRPMGSIGAFVARNQRLCFPGCQILDQNWPEELMSDTFGAELFNLWFLDNTLPNCRRTS
jgi:hypothetical protein